jgi:hypothetical protein
VVKLSKKNKKFRFSTGKKNPNYEKKYHFFHSPVNKNPYRIFFHFPIYNEENRNVNFEKFYFVKKY